MMRIRDQMLPVIRCVVGVSGSKDSVALTIRLALLRRYLGFDYEVMAVTLTRSLTIQAVDYSRWRHVCRYGSPTSAPHQINLHRV